ncbi:MAG: class I SAM-dependent methyltransferase [Verrucomicrobiota bacterium]
MHAPGRLVCPATHSALVEKDGTLCTLDGAHRYAVKDGIPQFLRFPPAESAEEIQSHGRLNQLARERGWREALQTVYGADSNLYRYVTDESRGLFLDVLELNQESVVLEIGPGLGQFTPALAARTGFVCALEVVPGQAQFTRERCRQAGRANVHVACGGDDCRLPYASGHFDAVVTNLVFEWCASRNPDEAAHVAQQRLLAEAHRVLKPGGRLWLATKNRYALRYLLGRPDEHAFNLPFGNALPRACLALLLRWKKLPRPPGVLYSHRALSRLLAEAGFADGKSFWAAPEMRFAQWLVPTDVASIRAARAQPGFVPGESRATRLLMSLLPAPLVKHFTPGLAFLAVKG